MTKATTTNARTANKPAAPAPAPTADQAQQEAAATSGATQEPDGGTGENQQQEQTAAMDNAAAAAAANEQSAQSFAQDVAGEQDAVHTFVVTSVPIRHDGKFYDVGDAVRLTDKQADRLGGLVHPLYLDKE